MLGRVPQRRRMAKLDLCIFFSQIDHKWIKVPERGAEDDVGAVEIDHGFHGLGAGICLRDVLLLDRFDARQGLERLDVFGV